MIPPNTALIDPQIHTQPFTSNATTAVAPCSPQSYSAVLDPSDDELMLYAEGSLDTTGKLYPGVLFCPGSKGTAQPRPMLPNTGNICLHYRFTIDPTSLKNGNVLETDAIFVIGGYHYNGSLQRLLDTGEIDIGGWTASGLVLGALTPNIEHEVFIFYNLNYATKALTMVSYEIDGNVSNINQPAIPATTSNWIDSVNGSNGAAYVQLQLGLMPSGNPVLIKFQDVELLYW